MIVERKKLKSLVIDIDNRIFQLNGEDMRGISELQLDFDNGKWSLLVTKDEMFVQEVTK